MDLSIRSILRILSFVSNYYQPLQIESSENKNKELFVVLTVPHAKCISTVEHSCDFLAEKAANVLKSEFEKLGIKVHVEIGDLNRTFCDLNRYRCTKTGLREVRKTGFRKRIRSVIRENRSDYRVVVFDVHSFPKRPGVWSENYDVYTLFDNKVAEDFARHFINILNRSVFDTTDKISAINIDGNNNDIMDEMLTIGIPCFLVEFNESLGKMERKLRFICENFSSGLLSFDFSSL